jgi:hypothetical protein
VETPVRGSGPVLSVSWLILSLKKNTGLRIVVKDAADIADVAPVAAAVGDAERKLSSKAAGKLPFDPTTDENPQPT